MASTIGPTVAKGPHGGGEPHASESATIWGLAFGYFAAYAPYSALTKGLSRGRVGSVGALSGLSILPLATLASAVAMMVALTALGFWTHTHRFTLWGRSWPRPTGWTLASGIATGTIVVTTTLAYTFEHSSIVFMMLLMRGGVLAIAPLVDGLSGRKVRWYSWVALALSAAGLVDAVRGAGDLALSWEAGLDVALYLMAYFLRLRIMSHGAKGTREENRRYFAEEQMVATPVALLFLLLLSWAGPEGLRGELVRGFIEVPVSNAAPWVLLVGLLSQLTGMFGGLIFLDARENSFCVPVNRASSVLAGVVASYGLAATMGFEPPTVRELGAAGLIGLAIGVLWWGPRWNPSRKTSP